MQKGPTELIAKTLDPLVHELAALHGNAVARAQASRFEAGKAMDDALRCGRLLAQAKEQLGHGEFGKWIRTHESALGFNYRTARRYMQLSNWPALANMPEAETKVMQLRVAYKELGIMPSKPKLGERIGASKATRTPLRINTPVRLANDLRLAVVRLRRDGKGARDLSYLRGLYGELRKLFEGARS